MEDVWINFPGAIQWWWVCGPIIEKYQSKDATIYEDYTRLSERLLKREIKARGPDAGKEPSADELREFLQYEVELVTGATAPQPPA